VGAGLDAGGHLRRMGWADLALADFRELPF
jgi:hypothetical protein